MFRIGDFSRLARVTIKTLHHYDEAGLLTPAHVNRITGYRYYAADQLQMLQRILVLKDLGFSLEDIRRLTSLPADDPELLERLDRRRDDLILELEHDRARLRRLEALRASVSRAADEPIVTHREVAAIEVHSHRTRVPALGVTVERLFESAEALVAAARADASPFLIFHDPEFRDEDVDVEVCIPVKHSNRHSFATRTIPAASVACLTYRGAYEQTPALYEAMSRWMDRSRVRLAGPLREVYHRFGANQSGYRLPTHVLAESSEDFVTELQVPVEPMASNEEE